MEAKKWNIWVLGGCAALLILFALPTIVLDPYFHFHAPVSAYLLNNERYQNDGIVKHFSYDALITGTSMTENFKTSQMDELFEVNSIKAPFAGGSYKEIDENIQTAIKYNSDLKIVVRGLDTGSLDAEKDRMGYTDMPEFLYDNNPFNDVNYVLNKSIFFQGTYPMFLLMRNQGASTTFDEYFSWGADMAFGREAILNNYQREDGQETYQMTEADRKRIRENIEQNVLAAVRANPQITFYYFLTPYSILWWDSVNQSGKVQYEIETQRIVIEQMLSCENLKLYAWFDKTELIENLNNYKDLVHYSPEINEKILLWMKEGEGRLSQENYEEYLAYIEKFYSNYDYDSLFGK